MAVSLRFPLFGLIIAVESFDVKRTPTNPSSERNQFMRVHAAAAVLIWSR